MGRVEKEGGRAKAVAAGWPKAMIETAAAARQARVDRGDDVIVGVNKYRRQDEDLLETLEVDNTKVREAQVARIRSEEHTSELQSLMRISYAVFCLKKKTAHKTNQPYIVDNSCTEYNKSNNKINHTTNNNITTSVHHTHYKTQNH